MTFGNVDRLRKKTLHLGPQERIAYHGDLKTLFDDVAEQYGIGAITAIRPKLNGYEDFNLELETSEGPIFAKCFADWRSLEDCNRYLEMIQAAHADGVRTPGLHRNKNGSTLTTSAIGGVETRLALMDYLDSGNVWESSSPLTEENKRSVIQQAARINMSNYRPSYVHDSWAIPNLAENYAKNRDSVSAHDRPIIEKLLDEFKTVALEQLPHAFVHGDIRSTNIMRHHDGQLYVIDFSVANYYPRIVEFAVLACDVLFDPKQPDLFSEVYDWALDEYRRAGTQLTSYELRILPLFVKLAHAANIIGSSSVDATNYISKAENDYWLRLGQKGMHSLVDSWKN